MNQLTSLEVSCSICGAEHDPEQTPELDSTHLCPECVASQRNLKRTSPATSAPTTWFSSTR